MKNNSVKKLVLNGLMIALVFLATYFTRIPTPLPGGYFNLGDALIMLAAAFLGPVGGLIAGAFGSGLADLAYGAFLFVPVTFIVKGLEGLVVGLLTAQIRKSEFNALQSPQTPKTRETSGASFQYRLIVSVIAGAAIMVAGYFLAEAFLLGIFDEAFGMTAAVTELLPNSIQGVLSAILGYILVNLLSKMKINKYMN